MGYRVRVRRATVMNVLRWRLGGGDARRAVPAADFQPYPAFPGSGGPVPVVTRARLRRPPGSPPPTWPARSCTAGTPRRAWWSRSAALLGRGRAVRLRLLRRHRPGGPRPGAGEHYDAELVRSTGWWATCSRPLPPGAALVVTADHGQVEVGAPSRCSAPRSWTASRCSRGEGRFRWLHVRPGAADDVAGRRPELYGDVAWVRTRNEMLERGMVGRRPLAGRSDPPGRRGPGALRADGLPRPGRHGRAATQARHGSLTAAEMLVPLLAWPVREAGSGGGTIGGTMNDVSDPDGSGRPVPSARRPSRPTRCSRAPLAATRRKPWRPPSRSTSRPRSCASARWSSRCSTRCAARRSTRRAGCACARSTSSPSTTSQRALAGPGRRAQAHGTALRRRGAERGELRIAQAQLVGWLEGLFHGIQATLMSQQMAARAQLEEMRQRGLPQAGETGRTGAYL